VFSLLHGDLVVLSNVLGGSNSEEIKKSIEGLETRREVVMKLAQEEEVKERKDIDYKEYQAVIHEFETIRKVL
jgi:3-hydroxy-3-methylglutaryl CoA synthase